MSRKSWWKWALFGLLALYSLLLVSRCSPIEQDLQARTTDALNEKGLSWATPVLEKRGRDVLLSGEAPSEEARELAISTAADVYGVRIVDNDITLKQYSTPVFGLSNSDGKTTLTGSFPKQDLIDQAVRAASDNFGADNVVNNMTISEDVSSPSWLPAAIGVLPAIASMTDADLDINNDNASLNGTFNTDAEKQSLLDLTTSAFGGKFTDNSTVVPLGPTPEELAEIARKAEEVEAARLAEEQRLAAEVEATRVAEEQRLAAEAEAVRLAEEQRLAAEAEATRLAEEAKAEATRIAEEAEATRIANEKNMAAIMLAAQKAREAKAAAARLAEEQRLAAEAEATRLAEEAKAEATRLAEEAEATRIANEKNMAAIMLAAQEAREAKAAAAQLAEEQRLAAEAEAARLAEEAKAEATRLAEEAEATRIANEKNMAAIMLAAQEAREAKAAAARLAEEQRLAAEAEAARLAEEAEAARVTEERRLANARAMTNEGCQQAIDETMRGQRVLFATASATIDRQSYELLNTLAQSIRRCEKSIEVSGHTDSRGAASMNMKLSQDRAQAVSDYLNNQSVGRSVISSRGYGETRPVADNNSAAGRRLNRRIQFSILK